MSLGNVIHFAKISICNLTQLVLNREDCFNILHFFNEIVNMYEESFAKGLVYFSRCLLFITFFCT